MDAKLEITGRATDDHSVPAEVLVRSIQGIQQSVLLLGAAQDQREIRDRFKPDQSLRKQYTLRLSPAEPGSYAVPMTLVDERPQQSLDVRRGANLLDRLGEIWSGVAQGDNEAVKHLLPNEGYRSRLLQEIRKMLPRTGDGWALTLVSSSHPRVELTSKHRPIVERLLVSLPDVQEMSVIGELLRIDFAEKRLTVRYLPTNQAINCSYLEEIEDSIVDARRGLFQIRGQFVLDQKGHPERLTDVSSVEPVDLSPALISEVSLPGGRLLLSPPVSSRLL